MSGVMISLLAARQAARREVIDALARAGACSPSTAQPLHRVGELDERALRACLDEGLVREGAPGTFYLYPWSTPAAVPRRTHVGRVIAIVVVTWIAAIILIPVLFVRFAN